MNVRKIFMSLVLIGVFGAYLVIKRGGFRDEEMVTIAPKTTTNPTPTATVPTNSSSQGSYKDGQYTSPISDAVYGPLQISVTIQNGKISDIGFLQYPNDRETSIRINTQAMPLLKSEAITAQSATIDGVSGATATTNAFIESLGSVLKQAS